jgi:hypothetical protein
MATFSGLQDEVQFMIGQRLDLNAFVKDKINRAILDVMLMVKPPEFFTTIDITGVAGQANYDITSGSDDLLAVIGVINEDETTAGNRRLIRGSYRDYDSMDTVTASKRGNPRKWFRWGNEIYLYDRIPEGSEDILVRGLERPTVLSADSDTFPLGLEWEEAVVLHATEMMFTIMGTQSQRDLKRTEFLENIQFVIDNFKAIEDEFDHDAGMVASTHQYRSANTTRGSRR